MTIIKIRSDIKSEWESPLSITPDVAEFCYEKDTETLKIGDGVHKFKDIPNHFVTSKEVNDLKTDTDKTLTEFQSRKQNVIPKYNIDSDSYVYSELGKMKRSTFRGYSTDQEISTKNNIFYAVVPQTGRTLTITADGIASGFSTDNYLRKDLVISANSNYTIKGKITIGQTNVMNIPLGLNATGNVLLISLRVDASNNRMVLVSKNNTSGNSTIFTQQNSIESGKTYDYIIDVKGSNLDFYFNGAKIDSNNTFDNLETQFIVLGADRSFTFPFTGSIDLKQLSITVDGIEVFSGNKTGTDLLKKDDYVGNIYRFTDGTHTIYANDKDHPTLLYTSARVVNTDTNYKIENGVVKYQTTTLPYSKGDYEDLVITDNGIASGFSSTNYLRNNNTPELSTASKWDILIPLHLVNYPSAEGSLIDIDRGSNHFKINLRPNGTIFIAIADTNGTRIMGYSTSTSFELNTDYLIKLSYDETSGYFLDINGNSTRISNLTTKCIATSSSITDFYFNTTNCSADLNKLKFIINNDLAYQSTLRIPYTQSKTDEKIVDAVYRDRVQDMYEQFGYTHYYTIGDVPEKYNVTKVGSPTLVGGVASGFSSSSYLLPSIDVHKSNIEVKFKFTTGEVGTVQSILGNWLGFYANNRFYSNIGDGDKYASIFVGANTTYLGIVSLKDNKHICKVSDDNGLTWKEICNVDKSGTADSFKIGTTFSATGPFKGSIDLSQFSIEVDGKEVFRGYEPAITDAFTLATHKGTDVIDSYSDGEGTYYEVRADLVQRCVGLIPVNTQSNETVVKYPRAFRDEKNIVQVSYFNVGDSTATATINHIAPKEQTKSGFTIASTTAIGRNYYAEGKAVLG